MAVLQGNCFYALFHRKERALAVVKEVRTRLNQEKLKRSPSRKHIAGKESETVFILLQVLLISNWSPRLWKV